MYFLNDCKGELNCGDVVFVLLKSDRSKINYRQGIFQKYNDDDNKQLTVVLTDAEYEKSYTLNANIIMHGIKAIPTVIRLPNISNEVLHLLSPPATKKIRLSSPPQPSPSPSSSICYMNSLYSDAICTIASFLTWSDYFSLKIVKKSFNRVLNQFKSFTSLDLVHHIPRDEEGYNDTKRYFFDKIGTFSYLQHLYIWYDQLNEIQFNKANPNLRELTICGDGISNQFKIKSSFLHQSNINSLILSWFGSRSDDDLFPFSNFDDLLFQKIEYLFLYFSEFQYMDLSKINQLFQAGLKGWGFYGDHELSEIASFTNFVVANYSSNLQALHLQSHENIQIPKNIKFNKLQEFSMVSSIYHENDMNLTHAILSKIDTLRRFCIETLSCNSGKRKRNLPQTMKTLFQTQRELEEIVFKDDYRYSRYIYDAFEYGVYFLLPSKANKNIIVTFKFDNFSPADIEDEATKICVVMHRLINCLLECYEQNNWRLHMEFKGFGIELYKEFKRMEDSHIINKLRNNNKHEMNITHWNEKGEVDFTCFGLEIYSKKCVVSKPNRWIFSLQHETDFFYY